MRYNVMANVDDEPAALHVEDCDSMDEAQELAKEICYNGFFYCADEDTQTYYPGYMLNSVTINKAENDN